MESEWQEQMRNRESQLQDRADYARARGREDIALLLERRRRQVSAALNYGSIVEATS